MKKRHLLALGLLMLVSCGLQRPIALGAASVQQEYDLLSDTAIEACKEYGKEYDICPELLMSMAVQESSGNHLATAGSCCGLMQMSSRWHQDRMKELGVADIYDEAGNVLLAADYLAELIEENGDDMAYILDLYNGNSNALAYSEQGKMSKYSTEVLERSAAFERLRGK